MALKAFFQFFSRGERTIIARVVLMLDRAIEASEHLLVQTRALRAYDYEAVTSEYAIIDDIEGKLDQDHRDLVREICTGSFFGGIREDLLALLENIDSIADASKDAAKIFRERRVPQDVVDYFFKADVEEFLAKCIDATKVFREDIKALEKSKSEVLLLSEEVEQREEEADALRNGVIEHLFRNEINGSALDIIMLKDFLVTADDVADNAEHGSDVLQILVAKGYS